MNPTPHLRWFECAEPDSSAGGTPVTKGRFHFSTNHYVLKQWWVGDSTGEWRIVPVSEDPDPPESMPQKRCKGCKKIVLPTNHEAWGGYCPNCKP